MSTFNFELDQGYAFASLLKAANALFSTAAKTWNEFMETILPPRIATLQRLSIVYEGQMLACRDSKSYFAACVMGAAMIEAFLLLLCMLKPKEVEGTSRYQSRCSRRRQRDFDQTICNLGFDDLIEISAELNWIPDSLISDEWKSALPEAYQEIAKHFRPNSSKASRNAGAASLVANPAYSLMLILNMMRNRVHPGRWVREGHIFKDDAAFADWAQVVLVAAAHIRDCLVAQHMSAYKEFAQQAMKAKLQSNISAVASNPRTPNGS